MKTPQDKKTDRAMRKFILEEMTLLQHAAWSIGESVLIAQREYKRLNDRIKELKSIYEGLGNDKKSKRSSKK